MTFEAAGEVRYARSSKGGVIAYQVLRDGLPVVAMPASLIPYLGLGLTAALPQQLAESTTAQVVTYHHLGSGLSDRDGYDFSVTGLSSELETVLDEAVVGPFVLFAHSSSAPVAVRYAARHPERVLALVLLRGWLDGQRHVGTDAFKSYRQMFTADWTAGAEAWAAFAGGFSGRERREVGEQAREVVEQGTYLEFLDALAEHDASALAPDVEAPTFVIGVTDTEESKDLARSIRGARLELTDNYETAMKRSIEIVAGIVEQHARVEEVASQPPVGLQTILFTDLAGSTAMQSRLGDEAAREVLRAHDAAVRQAIDEFNGREVKHTGDGMMTAFSSAADAVNCALAVRRDIATDNDTHEGEELLVRFGLNAGEPIAEDDDLFGLSVTLAARIGDWGAPGQVLVSDVVRQLLLGKGFEFTSVGSAELRGLDEPVALYEVTHD